MLTNKENTLTEHLKNDVLIPSFGPKYPDFRTDIGCFAVNKYIRGIALGLTDGRYQDVRQINFGKPLFQLFQRYSHRTFSESEYR